MIKILTSLLLSVCIINTVVAQDNNIPTEKPEIVTIPTLCLSAKQFSKVIIDLKYIPFMQIEDKLPTENKFTMIFVNLDELLIAEYSKLDDTKVCIIAQGGNLKMNSTALNFFNRKGTI